MTWHSKLAGTLVLAMLVLVGCSQDREEFVGTYTAQTQSTEVVLTLNEGGRGTWSTDLDEISFKWSTRDGGQLWLHTKEGGVIPATRNDGRITLSLPGVDEMEFTKRP